VLLFDHSALTHFEDNRVAIPITVLEELDRFKVGNETNNFEARETIRIIDRLSQGHALQDWIPVENGAGGMMKVIMDSDCAEGKTSRVFSERTNDHKILDAALCLQASEPGTNVILVSKDINLRLKAKALNLPAEDYQTGKVKDNRHMYTGKSVVENVDSDVIRRLYLDGVSRKVTALGAERQNNHFYILRDGSASAMVFHNESKRTLERVDKAYAYGIKPRNAEQAFALHAIQNPDLRGGRHRKDLARPRRRLGAKEQVQPNHLGQTHRGVEQQGFGLSARRCRGKGEPVHAASVRQPELHQKPVWTQRTEKPGNRRDAVGGQNPDLATCLHPWPLAVQCDFHCG
jgi:hypothetical protein